MGLTAVRRPASGRRGSGTRESRRNSLGMMPASPLPPVRPSAHRHRRWGWKPGWPRRGACVCMLPRKVGLSTSTASPGFTSALQQQVHAAGAARGGKHCGRACHGEADNASSDRPSRLSTKGRIPFRSAVLQDALAVGQQHLDARARRIPCRAGLPADGLAARQKLIMSGLGPAP